MSRLWTPLAITMSFAAIFAGGLVVSQEDDLPEGTANMWVDSNGGTCLDDGGHSYDDATACSFSGANSAADPGDLIIVKAGTYSSSVSVTTNGSSGNLITWRGEYTDGECPTTDNTDVNAPDTRPDPDAITGDWNISASFVRVECFKIRGASTAANFEIEGGETNVQVVQNYCDGDSLSTQNTKPYVCVLAGDIGAGLTRAEDVLVDNNYATEVRFGLLAVCNDCTFSNNEVDRLYGCVPSGGGCAPNGGGADDNDYSRIFGDNITFSGNYFHGSIFSDCSAYDCHTDCWQSWSFGNTGESATDITITRNTCMAMHQGVLVRDVTSSTFGDYDHDFNWTVTNNVFVGSQGGYPNTQQISLEHVGNAIIVNNTMVAPDSGNCAVTRLTDGSSGTFKNNLFYNCGGTPYQTLSPAQSSGNATNLMFQEGHDYTCGGTDVCDVDPDFVDESVHNYRTQSGSPARNAGTTTDPPTDDRDGTARPVNSVYDIGAYESG